MNCREPGTRTAVRGGRRNPDLESQLGKLRPNASSDFSGFVEKRIGEKPFAKVKDGGTVAWTT
ncbi:hypothetical protein FRUB_02228 [Fimbriiglobus ruber]|uniref:Uncharacterized protein n=1 Tax=Fimbriiglobus ruber TaxID=1908690 RepID=A0A225E2J5_9BACT|nr:hypothetical protein FRUB_02228 [Fimbriiglobus ruber]